MNPQIRARWVAALRSGQYRQGYEYLRDKTGGLCCLGVLCELAVADGVIPPPERHPLDGSWLYGEYDTELPESVMSWAGLAHTNPVAPAQRGASLSQLNDGTEEGGSWTFAQIADVIEGVPAGAGPR
jgi:hypothetical protein